MKKRFVSFLLAMIMICSVAPVAFAASGNALEAADALHELGLFNGTGVNADGTPNYDLNRAPTRHEAVTMLVRLLGKEEDAKNGTWNIPFTDVADWAKPYVGYAYTNGLTNGTSATTFGGNDTVTASQYLTFVLRALGYESGTDFQWDKAWELSDKIGLTSGEYDATTRFVRGDVALISLSALVCNTKNSSDSLFSAIQKNGGILEDIEVDARQTLKFTYLDETVRYEEDYIQNATVARIEDLYVLKFALMADHFSDAKIFPTGYHNDGTDAYLKKSFMSSDGNVDIATFYLTEEYIYKNPVSRVSLILDLKPILTAFPDDFEFENGLSERITAIIRTKDLPR